MDKSQGFFDPYNFNSQPNNMQFMQQQVGQDTSSSLGHMDIIGNPAMYYEQQYMYYKYLTQVLEYKMKLKEWEKTNKDCK
ncbi:MAG: hypothetical protein RSB67_00120 [Clostridia bacterium]